LAPPGVGMALLVAVLAGEVLVPLMGQRFRTQEPAMAEFDPAGVLYLSTYFGGPGNDEGNAIAVDINRNIIECP